MTGYVEEYASEAVRELADAVADAIRGNEAVADRLRALLVQAARIQNTLDVFTVLPPTIDRLATTIRRVIESLLPELVRDPEQHLCDIRRFFLDPQQTYTFDDLARLWGISIDDVHDIYHDELFEQAHDESSEAQPHRVSWVDAIGASRTFNLLRPFDIDIALGEDFGRVQSENWRTIPILIRLPRFIAQTITNVPSAALRSRSLAVRIEQFVLELYESEYQREYWRSDGDSNPSVL